MGGAAGAGDATGGPACLRHCWVLSRLQAWPLTACPAPPNRTSSHPLAFAQCSPTHTRPPAQATRGGGRSGGRSPQRDWPAGQGDAAVRQHLSSHTTAKAGISSLAEAAGHTKQDATYMQHISSPSTPAAPRPGWHPQQNHTRHSLGWRQLTRCCETRMASSVCGISTIPNSKGGFSGCHCRRRWGEVLGRDYDATHTHLHTPCPGSGEARDTGYL